MSMSLRPARSESAPIVDMKESLPNLTLERIAELAGVSRSTVSRVVNNHVSVRPEVRSRVLSIIEETGYQPNAAARSLAGRRTQTIGLVIPEQVQFLFTDPYFSHLIQAVAQGCNNNDYTLSLFLFSTMEDEERLFRRIINNQLVDGLILTGMASDAPILERLISRKVPFVLNGRNENRHISFVDADNFQGAYMATTHLIGLGHRRIATITGSLNNVAACDRLDGYKKALRDRGIQHDPALIEVGDFTEASGYECMRRLLQHQFTAIFVSSDTMAYGAIRALQEANKSMPDDVALIGYDDLPPAFRTAQMLSTVRQPTARAGELAVDTLIGLLENPQQPPRRTILPTQIIVRDTCGG